MINEGLRQTGSFSLRFLPTAPSAVMSQVRELCHIIITPAPLSNPDLTDAILFAAARYTGVVLEPVGNQVAGAGLGWWLGSDSHAGNAVVSKVTLTNVTLSSALGTLLPAGSAILPGVIDNTGLSNITTTLESMSQMAAVQQVCALAGASWRINADRTIDAALPATLHVTSPTAIIMDDVSAWGDIPKGVEASIVVSGRNARQYATKVIVVAKEGDTARVPTGEQTGAAIYVDAYGNPAQLHRIVDAPTVPGASAATFATQVLNLSTVRSTVDVTCRHSDIGSVMQPGDALYLFKPSEGFLDTATQIVHKGQTITPVTVSLTSFSWPATSQLGYYLRTNAGTIIDITEYVEYEDDAEVFLQVGQKATVGADTSPIDGVTGSWSDAASRIGGAPLISSTITTTTSNGAWESAGTQPNNYTIIWNYNIAGGRCRGTMNALADAGFTRGTGVYRWQHPLGAVLPAGRGTFLCGTARITDSGVGTNNDVLATINDAGEINLRFTASPAAASGLGTDMQVQDTQPMTWAAGDRVEIFYDFPVV